MKHTFRKLLKRLAAVVAALMLALVLPVCGVFYWLSMEASRQKVFEKGLELLQDKLQTRVTADSIHLSLLKGQVHLYGVQINDREDSLLLRIDELQAGIDPTALKKHRIRVSGAQLKGVEARLWRDSLHSNYQFMADAFRKKTDTQPRKPLPEWAGKWQLLIDIEDVNLQRVHLLWDVRHKQRKNMGKPQRGAFDANHVDVTLNLKTSVKQNPEGSFKFNIKELNLIDKSSGLRIDRATAHGTLTKDKVEMGPVNVRMLNTEVQLQPFSIDLKQRRVVQPFRLSADVLLQDLAQPFSPVLGNFTTPLQLTSKVSGYLDSLHVDDLLIKTPDEYLTLTANGVLDGLFSKSPYLNLQFRDIDLKATHSMKEQIVMHFSKKMRLKMIRQMKAIGDIRFQGNLDVVHRKEIISGRLTTRYGHVDTRFTIDNKEHTMIGHLTTPSLEMGQLMNIPGLGPVNSRIEFDLNISRKALRPINALPNGRLPLGRFQAWVHNAQYSSIVAPEVRMDVQSDGSTATGKLWMEGQLKNLSVDVSYTQTDDRQDVWFQSTHEAQQWLLQETMDLLSEKLDADVEADSITVHLLDGDAQLYGIRVKDQRNKPFFSMDSLRVLLDAQRLLENDIHISELNIYGIETQLTKDSKDTNFGFLKRAFKKNKSVSTATRQKKRKGLFDLSLDVQELNLERLHVKWDMTDEPLHQQENPNAGIFDVNHVDLLMNIQASAQSTGGIHILDIKQMSLKEQDSGLQIDSLRTHLMWDKKQIHVDSLFVRLPHSWVHLGALAFDPEDQGFSGPFDFSAHLLMQDLAESFAPAFRDFTTPLNVKGTIGGYLNNVYLDQLQLHTPNNGFNLSLEGDLNGLMQGKDALDFQLSKIDMQSDNETLMQLVNHFSNSVRLKMVRQMKALGNIHFEGKAGILPKRENISGILSTEYGEVQTTFTIDGNTQYMSGFLEVPALHLGRFLNVNRLGTINGHIDFNFNLNTKAPRPAGALPNGRLPQGNLQATINDAYYGNLRIGNIEATVNSDGSTASGIINIYRKLSNTTLRFNYIQTDDEQHLKIKPKFRLHLWRKRHRSQPFLFMTTQDEGEFVPQ